MRFKNTQGDSTICVLTDNEVEKYSLKKKENKVEFLYVPFKLTDGVYKLKINGHLVTAEIKVGEPDENFLRTININANGYEFQIQRFEINRYDLVRALLRETQGKLLKSVVA